MSPHRCLHHQFLITRLPNSSISISTLPDIQSLMLVLWTLLSVSFSLFHHLFEPSCFDFTCCSCHISSAIRKIVHHRYQVPYCLHQYQKNHLRDSRCYYLRVSIAFGRTSSTDQIGGHSFPALNVGCERYKMTHQLQNLYPGSIHTRNHLF